MELVIPFIALGGMYVVSNQKKKKTDLLNLIQTLIIVTHQRMNFRLQMKIIMMTTKK